MGLGLGVGWDVHRHDVGLTMARKLIEKQLIRQQADRPRSAPDKQLRGYGHMHVSPGIAPDGETCLTKHLNLNYYFLLFLSFFQASYFKLLKHTNALYFLLMPIANHSPKHT